MTDLDFKIFIGNRLSNLYVTLERLIQNQFPRGLFNEYENSILEISQLQELETHPNFLKLYENEVIKQAEIFKGKELENVSSKIAMHKTPTLLKKYCDELLANNFINFLNNEQVYIEELLAGRSRQKIKIDYLKKVIERLAL